MWTGDKYDKELSCREIAVKIREDIKAAKADGRLPEKLKVRVRSDHNSINIAILELGFNPWNMRRIEHDLVRPYEYMPEPTINLYNEETKKAMDVLEGFHDDYNYSNSDSQVDYFDENYYGGVSLDTGYSMESRKQAEEIVKAQQEAAKKTAEIIGLRETMKCCGTSYIITSNKTQESMIVWCGREGFVCSKCRG